MKRQARKKASRWQTTPCKTLDTSVIRPNGAAEHNVKTKDREEKDWARMSNGGVKVKRRREGGKRLTLIPCE